MTFTWTNTSSDFEEFVAVAGTEGGQPTTDGATIVAAGNKGFEFGSSFTANFGRSLTLTVVRFGNSARATIQAGGLTDRFGGGGCSAWANVLR